MNKLAGVLIVLAVCASNVALTQVSQLAVPFIGPDYIHLEYNATSPAGGWFKMKIVDPAAVETEILNLANGDSASFSGKFSQGIGANGNYKFGFAQRVWNGQQWVENGWEQAAFTLDNDAAGGTLLVDEELPPGLVLNDITVPVGKTLTLKGFYPHSPNTGTRVSVYGTVNLADAEFESYPGGVQGGFKYNSLHFDLHQATVISGVNGGHYSVNAAGISFGNCQNIVVDPVSSTTIGNVLNGGVVLGRLSKGVAVTAHDSSLYNSPDPYSYGNPNWMGAGELTMKDVVWSGLFEVRGGVVAINGCTFMETGVTVSISSAAALKMTVLNSVFNGNVSVSNNESGLISFADSVFNGPTYIYGRNIRFDACEFCPDSSGTHSVNLENRGDVEIRNSLFRGSLVFHNSSITGLAQPRWSEASTPTPTIANNAFMGPEALAFGANGYGAPQVAIPLGSNYYGDSIGKYTFAPGDNWSYGFLPAETGYAAKAYPATAFAPQTPLKAAPFTRTNRNNWPPQIWLNGHIIGQGTIPHHNGGLSSTASRILLKGRSTLLSLDVSCSEVTLGGVEFYARLGNQTVTPVREPILRRDPAAAGAGVLRNNGATVSFILPPTDKDQETVEVYYKTGTAVIPAHPNGDLLLLRGSATFKDPPPRELRIWVIPIQVDGIIGSWGVGNASAVASQLQRDIPNMLPIAASQLQVRTRPTLTVRSATTFITSLGMLNRVAAELAAFRWLVSNHVAAPDFIVAVMPAGLVAGGEGASFAGRRRVLFVDEEHPDAAIHELGHGVGLYLDQEQYDKYPPNGALLGACTIFPTESAGANEIKHLPSERHNWFEKWCAHYDFMGCANPVWSSTEAIGTFHNWCAGNLTSAKPMVKATPETTTAIAALNSGTKRLLVSGMVSERQPIPGTVRLFDLSRLSMEAQPLGGFGEYNFKAYDNDGAEISSQPFMVQTAENEWVGTVDVPLGTVACRIIKTYDSRVVPLDIGAAGLTGTKILSPGAGVKVGETLNVAWQTSCEAAPEVDQIRHLLFFRANADDEWEPLAGPTTGMSLETYSDMLPETTSLELRLVTSDGIDSVEDIVTGITVLPRMPKVAIKKPTAGATSQTNVVWSFTANVVNFPPHELDQGVWSSSLQGELGRGHDITALLDLGEHDVTFTVTTKSGKSVAAKVSVTVLPKLSAVDLALEAHDLRLVNRLADPAGLAFNGLVIGETNRFNVSVRNGGADTEARLRLYLTPPGGHEILLGTHNLVLEPFATHYISFAQLVTHAGIYEVRTVIDEVSPADPERANNERVWKFASSTTVTLSSSHHVMLLNGGGNYSYGSPVTVTVTPSLDYPYVFTGWKEDGTTVSTNLQYSFEVTTPRQLVATFVALINLPVRVLPDAGGSVTGAGNYLSGARATLTATPNAGYRFVCWYAPHNNRELSTALSYTFTVTEKIYIDARFALITDDPDNNGGGDNDSPDDHAPQVTAGTYDAVLSGSASFGDGTVATARGTMAVKITKSSGALSAKIILQGGTLSFSAKKWDQVAADGTATVVMTTRGGETLTLHVKGDNIWGELSGGRFSIEVLNFDGTRNRFVVRGDNGATAMLAGLRGSYAVALPMAEGVAAAITVAATPCGAGYLVLTIGNKGVVKVAGVLADGTRVSRSLPLQSDFTSAAIPLFVPLYAKKGSLSGTLALDPVTGILTAADAALLYWHNPGRRTVDGFTALLEVCGGRFDLSEVMKAPPLLLSAILEDVVYYVDGEPHDWARLPDQVPVTANGSRLLIAKGVKPKKISDRDSGAVWYEYDEVNPTAATFSLAARSGIFKGKFTLWCDYEDAKGKLVHKGVSVPYSGIMVPRRDASTAALATGLGHCLVPETNPQFKVLRLKRSSEVRLEHF